MKKSKKATKAKRGPKSEVLKLEGNWQELVKRSLKKKRPKEGWPT